MFTHVFHLLTALSRSALALLCCAYAASIAAESPSEAAAIITADAVLLSPFKEGVILGEDGDVHAVDSTSFFTTGDEGLQLYRGAKTTLLSAGRFESLDARRVTRSNGALASLITMIDADAGAVQSMLVDIQSNSVLAQQQLEFPQAVPDAACLFKDTGTGSVHVFTIDARGMLEQRLVFTPGSDKLVDLPIRSEVGVLGAEACAVDDGGAALFIADEALGVRRMPAGEETDAVAEPWMLVQPWGTLPGDVEDIALDSDGRLWTLTPDAKTLSYRGAGEVRGKYTFANAFAPGAITVTTGDDGALTILLVDAAAGALHSMTIAAPTSANAARDTAAIKPRHAMVPASAETTPVRRYGDAADDPAIYAGSATQAPLILGTDKREGLAIYDTKGQQRQLLSVGRLNNVDLLTDIYLGDRTRTIAAASNRTTQSITLFEINDGEVSTIGDVATGLGDVYGLCMYGSNTGAYVFINDTSGAYEQYRLAWENDAPTGERVRRFALPSQPEGCVADSLSQRIYMGEEAAGIWEGGAEPDGDAPRLVIRTSDALVADVEGMDIYRDQEQALLVVSSQGSDSYAVFDLKDNYNLRSAFKVVADNAGTVDGASETDGLAVSAQALPGYPRGILVVQDGRNRRPSAPQNFKIIDWRAVEATLKSEM